MKNTEKDNNKDNILIKGEEGQLFMNMMKHDVTTTAMKCSLFSFYRECFFDALDKVDKEMRKNPIHYEGVTEEEIEYALIRYLRKKGYTVYLESRLEQHFHG